MNNTPVCPPCTKASLEERENTQRDRNQSEETEMSDVHSGTRMNKTPVPPPRTKAPSKKQENTQHNRDQSGETEMSEAHSETNASGTITGQPSKPYVPPRQQPQPQGRINNKNETPLPTGSFTTEDETAKSGSGRQRQYPNSAKSSHAGEDSAILVLQKDAAVEDHSAEYKYSAKSESHIPENQPQPNAIQEIDSKFKSLEGQPVARQRNGSFKSSSNEDSFGQEGASKLQVNDRDMAETVPVLWSRLKCEIICEGQTPITFDVTDQIGLLAKLQFALHSSFQKERKLNELKKQIIQYRTETDGLVLTYCKEKVHSSEKDPKQALLQILKTNILDDIDCETFEIDSDKVQSLLRSIKETEPTLIRNNRIKVYKLKSKVFVVGCKSDLRKFTQDFIKPLKSSSKAKSTKSTHLTYPLKGLASSRRDCLVELDIVSYIKKSFPAIDISLTDTPSITGPEGFSQNEADEVIKDFFATVERRKIMFTDPNCARAFICKNGNSNKTLAEFVKSQILKSEKIKIRNCYIEVEVQKEIPTIFINCLNREEAEAAADIASHCLCPSIKPKVVVDELLKLRAVEIWYKNGKVSTFDHCEHECYVITTCDVYEQFNKALDKILEKKFKIPIPDHAVEYFTKFGKEQFKSTEAAYGVVIKLTGKSFFIFGQKENIKQAKKSFKESYAIDSIKMTSERALINQQKGQLDEIAGKYSCCWNARCDGKEIRLLTDVEYKTSWLDHTTDAKLTVIEGCAANIEFDVLLIFVTTSLFPVISESQLGDGMMNFITFTKELAKNSTRAGVGTVGLCPSKLFSSAFRSKEVMYLVVQDTYQTECEKIPLLPDNLEDRIREKSSSSSICTVGIPLETDNLQGTLSETEFCELLTKKWIDDWSQTKGMPELFVCSTKVSSEKLIKAADRTFKSSKGFLKRVYSSLEENLSGKDRGILVDVKLGSLLDSEADVIVNTTAKDLNLHNGLISSLILNHAGKTIQDDLETNYPYGIEHTEVAVTGPGDLPRFKYILHSSLQSYSPQKHDKAMACVKNFVKNCLYKAERLHVVTVAFPSLGTGQLGYPRRDVAAAMFDAVEEYKNEAVNPRLRKIYFVVFQGDEMVCKAFQCEERRRKARFRKEMRAIKRHSAQENCLKKTINIRAASVEVTVRINIQYIPSSFVVVDCNGIKTEKDGNVDAFFTMKPAKDESWNDTLVPQHQICDERSFRKMVQELIDKTEIDRITGLIFYPVTSSTFNRSVGDQIQMFTDEVQQSGNSSVFARKELVMYLRNVWFAVDEPGFMNAESQLIPSSLPLMLWRTITGSKQWEKVSFGEKDYTISIDIIGPDKKTVQSAVLEMKTALFKEESSKHNHEESKTKASQMKQSEEEYRLQGARPKTTGMTKKDAETDSTCMQKVTDGRKPRDTESFCLDALEVRGNVNHGIVDFLQKQGGDILTRWMEQIVRVFQVNFDTADNDKLAFHGSYLQMNAFQEYLSRDFPKLPKDTSKLEDDRECEQDQIEQSYSKKPITSLNSSNGIVYQYRKNDLRISIYNGDITKLDVDCIVSSASPKLTGKMGIEKAIMDAAGDRVKTACSQYKNSLVRVPFLTEGGNLRCKKIIHYAFPVLYQKGRKEIENAVISCIAAAEKQGLCSIAIPAIGSGSFGDPAAFASGFHDAITSYSRQNPSSSVRDIHFVDKAEKVTTVLEAFKGDFECLTINQAVIYTAEGNVTALKADAIAIFQDFSFNSSSNSAQKVVALSDESYRKWLTIFKEQYPKIGEVFKTRATRDMCAVCANVLLAVLIGDVDDRIQNRMPSTEDIKKTLKEIFTKSEKWGLATLGIPLPEEKELNVERSIRAMAETVFEYFCSTKESKIKEIHFLSENEGVVETFAWFLQKQTVTVEKMKTERGPMTHSAQKMTTARETCL